MTPPKFKVGDYVNVKTDCHECRGKRHIVEVLTDFNPCRYRFEQDGHGNIESSITLIKSRKVSNWKEELK